MRYPLAALAVGAALALAVVAHSDPPPEPNVIPTSWELGIEFKDPQSITLAVPGKDKPQTFWYVLYTVTNQTKADRMFVPDFVLYTDTGEVQRAGIEAPTFVFSALQKRHNNPLLTNLTSITGRLLQGEDNAKDGVAIWRDFDPAARAFDIFIGGLSGERTKVKLPVPIQVIEKDEEGKATKVTKTEIVLTKALKLSYSIPGEAAARTHAPIKRQKKQWVMR